MQADAEAKTEGQRGDDGFVFGVVHGLDHSIGKRGHTGRDHSRRRRAMSDDVVRGLRGPHNQGARTPAPWAQSDTSRAASTLPSVTPRRTSRRPNNSRPLSRCRAERALADIQLNGRFVLRSPFQITQHQRSSHRLRQMRQLFIQNPAKLSPRRVVRDRRRLGLGGLSFAPSSAIGLRSQLDAVRHATPCSQLASDACRRTV